MMHCQPDRYNGHNQPAARAQCFAIANKFRNFPVTAIISEEGLGGMINNMVILLQFVMILSYPRSGP